MPGRVIAIDGPAASGKSSVSRGVSSALRFFFLSSGHLYRTLAWGVVRSGIPVEDFENWIKGHRLTVQEEGLQFIAVLDGEDATPHLSDPEVAAMVSKLAAIPVTREIVNATMRLIAEKDDLSSSRGAISDRLSFLRLPGNSTSMPPQRNGRAAGPKKGSLIPSRSVTDSTRPARQPPSRFPKEPP